MEHVKSRLPWLLFLMLSATVTQMIMNSYEAALAVMPQLAGFIPMLTGTGGNCGSQSSTLVIRGIAVEEIEFGDLFRVVWKEVRIAVCISLVLAVVNGIRILLMGQGDVLMALTIGLTMACTVIIAKVVGCTRSVFILLLSAQCFSCRQDHGILYTKIDIRFQEETLFFRVSLYYN